MLYHLRHQGSSKKQVNENYFWIIYVILNVKFNRWAILKIGAGWSQQRNITVVNGHSIPSNLRERKRGMKNKEDQWTVKYSHIIQNMFTSNFWNRKNIPAYSFEKSVKHKQDWRMVYLTAKNTYIYKNVLSIHRKKMSSEELRGRQYK